MVYSHLLIKSFRVMIFPPMSASKTRSLITACGFTSQPEVKRILRSRIKYFMLNSYNYDEYIKTNLI